MIDKPRQSGFHARRSLARALLFTVTALVALPGFVQAQVLGPRVGITEVGLLLRQLDGEKRVLMIGAHPDDEDTAMISALARGYGARTAYLSLTRGEGGQNLIGPELGEGLGLIRTGELLSARSLDGGEQFFTRAFDFGFSKNADETLTHWPLDELVRDVTWAIRVFRPHVILSVFSGTPRDGHGQHQAAGIAARRAFEVAGDSGAYPDQMQLGVGPWAPMKFYQLNRFGGSASTVEVQTGRLDPLVGRSFFQIAMDSRSQHRSQDMGSAQSPGPRVSGGTLESSIDEDGGSATPASEPGFFAGVDTTLAGLAVAARVSDEVGILSAISGYREAIAVAGELLHPDRPEQAVAALGDALAEIRTARDLAAEATGGSAATELTAVLDRRSELVGRALLAGAGVVFDARADRDILVPGSRVEVLLSIWNGGGRSVRVDHLGLDVPDGWTPPTPIAAGETLEAGEIMEWAIMVDVPSDARPSQPYFLEQPRDGDLYRWPIDGALMGRPGNPDLIVGVAEVSVDGGPPIRSTHPAAFVGVDQASGEYRLPISVVPAMSIAVEPGSIAWREDGSGPRSIAVRVQNFSLDAMSGDLSLIPPEGWTVRPGSVRVSLEQAGAESSFSFEISPEEDTPEGRYDFRAVVRTDQGQYGQTVSFVDYPHIDRTMRVSEASLEVSYFGVDVRPVTVGYVMGPGDSGFQALQDLGLEVVALDPEYVRSGDLDRFDTIVLGSRAYETREDLRASNERLLDFGRRGGTIIVQYNQYQYPAGSFAPYPVDIARPHDRVTDELAPITLLDSSHPLLASPNPIGPADFEGWVQERGLYFLSEWDEAYTPLMELSDPGEDPKRGALLVTRLGDGAYVYTGLALFRQFPAGVPGAFRILANLVSLRGSDLPGPASP